MVVSQIPGVPVFPTTVAAVWETPAADAFPTRAAAAIRTRADGLLRSQCNPFSRARRFASCIQDLGDNHVVLEG